MQEHELKPWPVYFDAIFRGDKNFEIRRDDRGFQTGDILWLRRYDPKSASYEDPVGGIRKRISYIVAGGKFGIEPGYVAMGLQNVCDEPEAFCKTDVNLLTEGYRVR